MRETYKDRPLRAYGKNTITSFGQLLREIENIKKQGYAIDNEEYYEGARCIAAPIMAGGRIEAVISVNGFNFTITIDRMNR
ncbi:MAG: IclR family transcriptional regulator C-terminal domain-containing protein [Deltaproteobacteria bacterium]|nr:IclR family transcriptional regulator C-terminal domain-containing protein [Deltaproteobacteria bacterium]